MPALVEALRGRVDETARLTSQIAGGFRAHADGHVFRSLVRDPGSSLTAATLLAEIGDCREPRHRHAWARAVSARALARGCDHPHAIRIPGRAWLRVIHQMWISRTPYGPARRGSLQRLAAEGG